MKQKEITNSYLDILSPEELDFYQKCYSPGMRLTPKEASVITDIACKKVGWTCCRQRIKTLAKDIAHLTDVPLDKDVVDLILYKVWLWGKRS